MTVGPVTVGLGFRFWVPLTILFAPYGMKEMNAFFNFFVIINMIWCIKILQKVYKNCNNAG